MVHISGGETCLYTLLKKQNKNTENVTKSFTENNTGNIYIDCNSLSLITALQFYGGRGGGHQDNLATNLFIYVFQYRILCIIYLNILLSLCIAISNKFFLVNVEIDGDE